MSISEAAKKFGIDENILRALMQFESATPSDSTSGDAAKGSWILPLDQVIPDAQRYALVPFHGVPNMSPVSHGPYVKAEEYEKLRTQFIELLWSTLRESK